MVAAGGDAGEIFPDLIPVKGGDVDLGETSYDMEFESPEDVGGPEGFDRIMRLMQQNAQITLPEEDGGDEVVDGTPLPMPDDTEWL